MKYVIFKGHHMQVPVIFPECIAHSQVTLTDMTPISAGFCTRTGNVYGKAESLGLSSRPEDSVLVSSALAESGVYAFLNYEDLS